MAEPQNSILSKLSKFFHSVRFRLTLWFVAILAVILAIFSLFIYSRQVQVYRTEATNRVINQSSLLSGYYHEIYQSTNENDQEGSQALQIASGSAPLLGAQGVMILIDTNRTIVQQIGDFPAKDLENVLRNWKNNPSAKTISYSAEWSKSPFTFHITPFQIEDKWQGFIVLGSQIDAEGQLPRLAITLVLFSLVILMLAFGGGYWLADRAMRPVQLITRTAHRISETDLSQRLRLDRADELGELAKTFDEMLERLQAAFQRQKQFTADVSHELRTPLTIIELEASRALDHNRPPDEYKNALQVIQSENEWMSHLVNELLTLARMEAGQIVMARENVDLSELAVDVLERLEGLAHAKGVRLDAGGLEQVEIEGDRGYLLQMLTNLVGNAIKYSYSSGGIVRVKTGLENRQGRLGGWVRVEDNGPGIPAEHLPHLFERFYRVDIARSPDEMEVKSTSTGSGLGLAIAYSIAESMGGTIEVDSQPGKGSVFTVWLPCSAT